MSDTRREDDRRRPSGSWDRLDWLAVALVAALAVIQLGFVVLNVNSGSGSTANLSAAAAGAAAAALLGLLALARAQRLSWARPAIVVSLIVFVAFMLFGGPPSSTIAPIALPLACLGVLVVVLQRRGHIVELTAADFVTVVLVAGALAAALFVEHQLA